MNVWTELLLASVIPPGMLLAAGYLSKTLLSHSMAKELEAFKASLSSETERMKASLGAELARQNAEHQTRFSILHERRAEAIAEIYEALLEAEATVRAVALSDGKSIRDESGKATSAIQNLSTTAKKKRIYIDERLAGDVDELIATLWSAFVDSTYSKAPVLFGTEQGAAARLAAFNTLKVRIPELRNELVWAFQRALSGSSLVDRTAQDPPTH